MSILCYLSLYFGLCFLCVTVVHTVFDVQEIRFWPFPRLRLIYIPRHAVKSKSHTVEEQLAPACVLYTAHNARLPDLF